MEYLMVLLAKRKGKSIIKALVFLVGLLMFVWLLQLKGSWKYLSLLGLVGSSVGVVWEIRSYADLARLFDLKRFSERTYYFALISILLGILWGMAFRDYLHISLLPSKIKWFALTAMMIGSVEELIFRGYIQQKLRDAGRMISIVLSSALHTFYKCFIFLVLPSLHPTDYFLLAIWTFGIGCILGALKEYSQNTWVPLSGHAVFDLVVYGDRMVNSWWVWL